ncbi:transposase [Tetragenococcus muriaticus PMC-11-5]|uniref:Mutator family transposase n=1 Tax=Tetragenococcus muriaticus PMC-11-5 TaxID=1302649 RepID=A0A091BZE2_9ENTE|nr:transposase [Tetragenococcus muriaticus PMC-11-5]
MTQLHINIDFEKLTEAIMQSDMNMMMKSLAVPVLNAYMEVERDEFIQAQNYERNDQRLDYRNGYYERNFILAVGKLRLKIPRTRSGEFSTQVFEQYQRKDQAFVLSLMEAVIQGVSTKKVTHIVEELCGESVSKSFVSNTMKRLDPEIEAFKSRSLTHSSFRYVYVDAWLTILKRAGRLSSFVTYNKFFGTLKSGNPTSGKSRFDLSQRRFR